MCLTYLTYKSHLCVPKVSGLAPLVLLIYIDNLPKSSKLLSFYLFADGTKIYFEFDNLAILAKRVNNELRKVKSWLDCNKLALNTEAPGRGGGKGGVVTPPMISRTTFLILLIPA